MAVAPRGKHRNFSSGSWQVNGSEVSRPRRLGDAIAGLDREGERRAAGGEARVRR